MPETMTGTAALPSAGDLAALTVVADGDSYVVGSPRTAQYVDVPEIGARIIEWLREGVELAECERRAARLAGEAVDVVDFLAALTGEGLFGEPGAGPDGEPGPGGPTAQLAGSRRQRLGAVLFHPVAWAGYGATILVGIGLLVARPELRPNYRDGFPFTTQLLNILVMSVIATAVGVTHEFAHVIASARLGLRSRLSVSRRLYFIAFQADLTRLWSMPRRARYGPLLAGLAWETAIMSVALVAEAALAGNLDPVPARLLRAVVLLQFTRLVAQCLIFMRTDVYALLVNATGCKTLWATKGALLRRLLRRDTAVDRQQLADADARELGWARRYLWLYVPGVTLALVYLVSFVIPGLYRSLELCLSPIRADGLTTAAAWEGVAALAVGLVPTTLAVVSAVRSGARVCIAALRRRRRCRCCAGVGVSGLRSR